MIFYFYILRKERFSIANFRYTLAMKERLQKILSARGIASRRKAEEYIEAGLVKVNGVVAKIGDKADPEIDDIVVDGKVIEERKEMLYYLLYKPAGVVTSNVEKWPEDAKKLTEGQKRAIKKRAGNTSVPQPLRDKTVRDLLPKDLQGKIYPVGRLDKESEGLLLLTNDGPLVYRLTHPKFDHEKEYEVTVNNPLSDTDLQKMAEGMIIKGEKTKPAYIEKINTSSFAITLTEGKNRQIRRMCEKVGYRVIRLARVRIMTLSDAKMKAGDLRPLTMPERVAILTAVGIS